LKPVKYNPKKKKYLKDRAESKEWEEKLLPKLYLHKEEQEEKDLNN
jgi:hypothetical protein